LALATWQFDHAGLWNTKCNIGEGQTPISGTVK